MIVAVPRDQQWPRFGHRASSHTVCRFWRRSSAFVSAYSPWPGSFTLSHSGKRRKPAASAPSPTPAPDAQPPKRGASGTRSGTAGRGAPYTPTCGWLSCGLPSEPTRRDSSSPRIGSSSLISVLLHDGACALAAEREHPIERDARMMLHVLGHPDRIHDVTFRRVLERPQEVRGIDAIHGCARTHVLLQRADRLVRVL